MVEKIRFLMVNEKNTRRHSAPAVSQLPSNLSPFLSRPTIKDFDFQFEVFLENGSESSSSLELDTSYSLKGVSVISESNSSLRDCYVHLSSEISDTHSSKHETWRLTSWRMISKNILLGHFLAVCLAVADASNDFLQKNPLALKNGQNLPFYVSLTLFWTTKLSLRNKGQDILDIIKYSGLRYFLLAVLHVEVNYLLLFTTQNYSYLGNQIIDCFAALLTLFIAYILLEVRFYAIHISGFILTTIGSLSFFAMELITHKKSLSMNDAFGDVLRMGSGACLAYTSAAQEIIVKATDAVEYTGTIAIIASLICACQTFLFEPCVYQMTNPTFWLNLFPYWVAQFAFQSLTPKLIRDIGATGFHLMLSTTSFYFHCLRVVSGRNNFQIIYLVPYAAASVGSSLFAMKKTSIGTQNCFPVKTIIMK